MAGFIKKLRIKNQLKKDDLNIEEKVELIKNSGLEREALAGELSIGFEAKEKIEMVKSAGLEKAVVLGEIAIDSLESEERIEMVITSGLGKEILIGEVNFLNEQEKIYLATKLADKEPNLIREILLGEIKISDLTIEQKIHLVECAGLEKEVLLGDIGIEGISNMQKYKFVSKLNLEKEVLLGQIQIENLPSHVIIDMIEETGMEKEAALGEIKVEGLDIWGRIRYIRKLGLEKEVLAGKVGGFSAKEKTYLIADMPTELEGYIRDILDGKIIDEDCNKDDIVECFNCYLATLKEEKKLKTMDVFHAIRYIHNPIYWYIVKKILEQEIETSQLDIDGIDDLMKMTDIIGQDTTYLMIKYYNEKIGRDDFGKILDNPDAFIKFRNFSKDTFTQRSMEIMDVRNAIEYYNGNTELILECMESELTSEEKKMFAAVLREKSMNEKITSKDELHNFAEIRKDKFAKMIDTQSIDIVTILLTGMDLGTYEDMISKYLYVDQLENVMNSFSQEESKVFQKVKAINQIIELIERMPEEKKIDLLHDINNELGNEFSAGGSEIAAMRQAFFDVEVELKRLYGKELSNSLVEVELPEAVRNEEIGVDIIKLDGQDFTLLIHTDDKTWGTRDNSEIRRTHMCASLISQDHLDRYENDGNLCYAFSNVGVNSLIMENYNNLCSNLAIRPNSVEVRNRQIYFDTVKGILEESQPGAHNEVDLWYEYSDENGKMVKLMPDYLVVFDKEIDPVKYKDVVDEAKRLGIPIILIDENRYKEKMAKKSAIKLPQEESSKIRPRDIYIETIGKVTEIAPALKQEEGMRAIAMEMEKVQGNKYKGADKDGK